MKRRLRSFETWGWGQIQSIQRGHTPGECRGHRHAAHRRLMASCNVCWARNWSAITSELLSSDCPISMLCNAVFNVLIKLKLS